MSSSGSEIGIAETPKNTELRVVIGDGDKEPRTGLDEREDAKWEGH